ncbi:hypothetical protein [Alkalibacillus silvisoli]|uniref:Pilus assembly protein PilM n=1 Tax=Alkalibacillus silvisoli TaxID=392823 RepID=A0ABP3JE24_9BACI
MRKKMINLEIKDYVIRFIESNIEENNIERIGEHFIPPGIISGGVIEDREKLQRILETCMKKWRLKRKKVRLLMPDSLVFIRREMVPLDVAKDEVKKHIDFHIGETIHLPFEQSVAETVYIRERDRGHEVSIISTDKDIANQYTHILESLSLKVEAIDISPLSYYRVLYEKDRARAEDHLLLIQYHVDRAIFSAFIEHTPIFLQEFDLESNEIIKHHLGATLSKEDFNEEAVMNELDEMNIEVERVERFYQFMINNHEQKFTKIAVVGDHPYVEEIVRKMKELYETPIINLQEDSIAGPKGMALESKFHNVYGLALKGGR